MLSLLSLFVVVFVGVMLFVVAFLVVMCLLFIVRGVDSMSERGGS